VPVYKLDPKIPMFPDPTWANSDGLLAIDGALTPDWLLLAYESGIFPWFNEGDPIMWWSPDPRSVLKTSEVTNSKSMRPYLNNRSYHFKLDTAFEQVMTRCASVPRNGQEGTWITDEMLKAYCELHQIGVAHSAEIWHDNQLIGGLYGVSLGRMFFGESMFSLKPNASKLALIRLCSWLELHEFKWIDCQIHNSHLASMGAKEISRTTFLQKLGQALERDTILGKWSVV
jgi:leucyl/phenylalanyl-tRNA--protein transferase